VTLISTGFADGMAPKVRPALSLIGRLSVSSGYLAGKLDSPQAITKGKIRCAQSR
jgi:hypothetical protein